MLWLAFKPPHPEAKSKSVGNAVSRRTFQFNLTGAQYKVSYVVRNN